MLNNICLVLCKTITEEYNAKLKLCQGAIIS